MLKKVLIVDDDPDILEALEFTFDASGYDVKTASKSAGIYKLIDIYKPNVMILDVLLSGSDGRIICRKLKSSEKTKHTPIIMISAHPDAKRSTMEAGADEFVAKPFDIYNLIKKADAYSSN